MPRFGTPYNAATLRIRREKTNPGKLATNARAFWSFDDVVIRGSSVPPGAVGPMPARVGDHRQHSDNSGRDSRYERGRLRSKRHDLAHTASPTLGCPQLSMAMMRSMLYNECN
jgi:hypothetical protein